MPPPEISAAQFSDTGQQVGPESTSVNMKLKSFPVSVPEALSELFDSER